MSALPPKADICLEHRMRAGQRLIQFRGNKRYCDYKELDVDAVLKLVARSHEPGYWHWIVWDAKSKKTLDPKKKPYKIPPAKIKSYLPVWR